MKLKLKSGRLDALSRRLQHFREQLNLHVLVSLREHAVVEAALGDKRFALLARDNQEIMKALLICDDRSTEVLKKQKMAVNHRLDKTDEMTRCNFEEVVAAFERLRLSGSSRFSRVLLTLEDTRAARQAVLDQLQFR